MKAGTREAPVGDTAMELVGDQDIIIARAFKAPARLIYEAWTKPEFVRRWWAPKSHSVELAECTADVRVGGEYRYLMRRGEEEYGFRGTYQELTPHTKLVYTQIFEPFPDAAVLVTVTLAEVGNLTHLVSHERYPSPEARAGALEAGMEHGMRETMDQLDALLASLT